MGKKKEHLLQIPRATIGRGFVAPKYSPKARRFMILVGGWYLRVFEGVRKVKIKRAELLLDELERFYEGDHRLIIAFRHVAKEDAPVMMFALNRRLQRLVRKKNRKKGKQAKIIVHAQFLYGSDVLDWAGKAAAWLFPKIGCVPVQNRGTNKNGLNILRNEVREGQFPIALAPEAQVTYHMYRCSPIASGIASIAAWGAESGKDVTIVPIAIGYHHTDTPESFIQSVLERWEQQTGEYLQQRAQRPIIELLLEATEKTVALLEEIFHSPVREEQDTRQRILAVCDTILQQAESMTHLPSEGSLLDRIFRLRYRGVEAIHPEGFDPKKLVPVRRSFADLRAIEAHIFLRHQQIVDVLEYIDPSYIARPCSAGRACEYALNLLDVTNRITGGTINSRYSPKGKRALLEIGKPIRLTQLFDEETNSNRKQRLQRISDAVLNSLQDVSEKMEHHWESQYFES